MTNLERISIYVTPELKNWFKTESESMGVKMSSYISILLNNYREGKDGNRALQYLKEKSSETDLDEAREAVKLMSQLLKSQQDSSTRRVTGGPAAQGE